MKMEELARLYQIINEKKKTVSKSGLLQEHEINVVSAFDCNLLLQYPRQSKKAFRYFKFDDIENNDVLMFLYLCDFATIMQDITIDEFLPNVLGLYQFVSSFEQCKSTVISNIGIGIITKLEKVTLIKEQPKKQ